MTDRANADEGADPTDDIRRQNPGETTTGDLAGQDDITPGGREPEKVEKRPNVGQVEPEDYPQEDRENSGP